MPLRWWSGKGCLEIALKLEHPISLTASVNERNSRPIIILYARWSRAPCVQRPEIVVFGFSRFVRIKKINTLREVEPYNSFGKIKMIIISHQSQIALHQQIFVGWSVIDRFPE